MRRLSVHCSQREKLPGCERIVVSEAGCAINAARTLQGWVLEGLV